MNTHREILNKLLAALIANLDLAQIEQLQQLVIEMTKANNTKVATAFVKFESEIPSETCEQITMESVPNFATGGKLTEIDIAKIRENTQRVVDIKTAHAMVVDRAHSEAIRIENLNKQWP